MIVFHAIGHILNLAVSIFFTKQVQNKTIFVILHLSDAQPLRITVVAFRHSRLSREGPCGLTYREPLDWQLRKYFYGQLICMQIGFWGDAKYMIRHADGPEEAQRQFTRPSILFLLLVLLSDLMIMDLSASQSFAIPAPVHFLLLFMWH